MDTTEFSALALALHDIQNAPVRSTPRTSSTKLKGGNHGERSSKSYNPATNSNVLEVATKAPITHHTKHSTTPAPTIRLTTTKYILRRPRPVEAFDKISPITTYTYKPISEYDYYDDGDTRIVSSIPEHSKVLIHSNGVIQCLDQGNFPHPVSCKKFISCAKMENGNVLGWEYTCPKNLSFDPVGGMCNWSAGLGCNE